MRRARRWALRNGPYHAEASSLGVIFGDEEGFRALWALVERGLLEYSPPHSRDWGFRIPWKSRLT
jgi:hypothetical protein